MINGQSNSALTSILSLVTNVLLWASTLAVRSKSTDTNFSMQERLLFLDARARGWKMLSLQVPESRFEETTTCMMRQKKLKACPIFSTCLFIQIRVTSNIMQRL